MATIELNKSAKLKNQQLQADAAKKQQALQFLKAAEEGVGEKYIPVGTKWKVVYGGRTYYYMLAHCPQQGDNHKGCLVIYDGDSIGSVMTNNLAPLEYRKITNPDGSAKLKNCVTEKWLLEYGFCHKHAVML